jgi:hypothetical protein
MLNVRVKLLRAFLRDVEDGKVKATAKQLRDIKSVCNRLPTVDSQTVRFTARAGARLPRY